MNYKFFSPLLFIVFSIHSLTVSTDEFSWQNDSAQLKGNVILQNENLKLQSDQANIIRGQHDQLLKEASLEKDVRIELINQGILSCDFSHIDFTNLRGKLLSKSNPIGFQGLLDYKNDKQKLSFICNEASFFLSSLKKNSFFISNLLLQGDVRINLKDNYFLNAEIVSIDLLKDRNDYKLSKVELKNLEDPIVINFPGGIWKTKNLLIDLLDESIQSAAASIQYDDTTLHNIEFEGLRLDLHKKNIFLKGPIFYKSQKFGSLSTKGDIRIERYELDHDFPFHSIFVEKEFEILQTDQKLYSASGCKIDHALKKLHTFTEDFSLIIYDNPHFKLIAKKLEAEYDDSLTSINKLYFLDHVCVELKNPYEGVHQILADRVTYDATLQEIRFDSNFKEKILFLGIDKELLITVDTIIINIDKETNKFKIRTLGILKSESTKQIKF